MVQCGTITVGGTFDPSTVSITDCNVTKGDVNVGERGTVEVHVTNTGDINARFDLTISVGNVTTQFNDIGVPSNATNKVTGQVNTPTQNGNHSVQAEIHNVREA